MENYFLLLSRYLKALIEKKASFFPETLHQNNNSRTPIKKNAERAKNHLTPDGIVVAITCNERLRLFFFAKIIVLG